MFNINFKDYFWGKCAEIHERYHLKKITISNIIEAFTRLQESMSNYAKELNSLITKDYILYPEKNTTKYEAMEFIKLFLAIQSTQLNIGVEIIKSRILDTIKIIKEEEETEKDLYNDLKKNINKYEESKANLNKAKEKFYQSCQIAEASVREAKEFALKKMGKENVLDINSLIIDNSEEFIKLEQKSFGDLLEARKNDEKYMELIKEANNYRELVNDKQAKLLKFYENIENKDHHLYISIIKDYFAFLKNHNSVIKDNIIQLEGKINKINYNNDIIALINIYGSEKKPDKLIKYRPYNPDFYYENAENIIGEKDLSLNCQIIMGMRPFIKDLCPKFDIALETKKQEMRDLTKKIVNNKNDVIFTDDDKNTFLRLINEQWGQNYFLYFLSKIRSNGQFCLQEELAKFLAGIFQKILISAEKKRDFHSTKNCIILSQTYYYQDKNNSEKVYLVELISDNKWLRSEEFWRDILDVLIKEDIDRYKKIRKTDGDKVMSQKAEEESITNIVFGQVISYVKNMKDFKIENKVIIKIVDEFVAKYNINQELSKQIYNNIANEKEVEELRNKYKNENLKENEKEK